LADASHSEFAAGSLRMRPMAQDGAQAGGIQVGRIGQIDDRVPDIGLSNGALEIEERLKCEWTMNTKNGRILGSPGGAHDLDLFHDSEF